MKLEPISFYLKLPMAAALTEAQGPRALRIAALLVVSQLANAAGFFVERISPKQKPPT